MNRKNLLLEIGTEEIPAGYIKPAMKLFTDSLLKIFKDKKLDFESVEEFNTPRRFTLKFNQIKTGQEDEIIEKTGPAKRIAFAEDGSLSKAGAGFLRGAGVEEKDYFIKETPRGEYIAFKKEVKGRELADILADALPEVIKKIQFPKSMKWSSKDFMFARPVRWIVALLNDEIINIKFDNLVSGNISYGNRFSRVSNPVTVNSADTYLEDLKSVHVIADRKERKALIEKQMENIFPDGSMTIVEDKKLLETVTDLVEYPTAVLSEFNSKYLILPEKIITSTLTQHQKYFAVKDSEGKLSNKFVFISNGDPAYSDIIRLGNEKVVTARLEDASFYYNEDTAKSLDSYVQKLEEVTFQEKLGTLREKTERVCALVRFMADKLNLDENTRKNAERAALLAKADLVTLMLGEKEFTKLQGYIGQAYALKTGENREVAEAIYQHYMPRGPKDGLPGSPVGALVAVADKIDTVCGIMGVGLIPTGSGDPFALRRAANGAVQITVSRNWEFSLFELIETAFKQLELKLPEKNNNIDKVKDFFAQRIEWFMQQNKISYDVIDSIKHSDWSDIPLTVKRAEDIQLYRNSSEFLNLVGGYKRVANILAKTSVSNPVSEELLAEDAEKALFEYFDVNKSILDEKIKAKNFKAGMEILVKARMAIDNFFDKVLVNSEDEKLKNNRLALLEKVRTEFLKIADISKIVIEEENKK
ncbi:MAG: glycine--tRNA ligase subunit beta [Candidatus Cloacimonadota bacterium]|nr:MAG: glycine--tRNA ligase subunit beta [Candidatus Cloacimonadota bacterium]